MFPKRGTVNSQQSQRQHLRSEEFSTEILSLRRRCLEGFH